VIRLSLWGGRGASERADKVTSQHNAARCSPVILLGAGCAKRPAQGLFVDLDGFKEVNATWGHAMGDGVLQEVARCLLQSIRASDSVTRLAGDEFVIVLPDIGAHAADVDRKILDALSHGCVVEGRQLALTASIGISLYPFAGHALDTLLKSADRAMYGAKRRGKNTYAFFTEGNRDAGAP